MRHHTIVNMTTNETTTVPFTAEEEAAADAMEAKWLAGEPSRAALAEIAALELSQTQRRVREAALTQAGADWLAVLDAKIAALRTKI